MTQSPQLEEAAADNTTDVLLPSWLSVEEDVEMSYDRDRLDDVITNLERQVGRRQLA